MAKTRVEVVTPSGLLYAGQADMVTCRTEGGDIAFLANHMPYVGVLQPHPLKVAGTDGGGDIEVEVNSGFVEVSNNRVVVLCDAAGKA